MAYRAPGTFQDSLNYLQTGGTDNGQIKDLSAAPTDQAAAAAPATEQQQPTAAAPQTAAPQGATVAPSQAGSILDRLFNPAKETAQGAGSQISNIVSSFKTQAGPSRTFESVGGKGIAQQAIQGGIPQKEQTRQFLNARYEGPAGLDADTVASINAQIAQASNTGQAYTNSRSTGTLLQQARPGLTRGEARTEAGVLFADPEFQQRRSDLQTSTKQAQAASDQAVKDAQNFATQRAQEEQNLAQSTRNYLLGEQQKIVDAAQQKIDADAAQRVAMENEWKEFLNTGVAPEEVQQQVAGLQPIQDAQKAQAKWDEILNNPAYAAIRDLPLLQMTTSPNMGAVREPEGGWAKFMKAHPGVTRAQRQLMLQRQNDLEKWFAPKVSSAANKATAADKADAILSQQIQKGEINKGVYSKFKPLYFSGDANLQDTEVPTWTPPPTTTNYLSYDPGLPVTLASATNEEQQTAYNNIADLLSQVERLSAVDPARAAAITLNVDKFLTDAENNLKQWDTQPTEAAVGWFQKVNSLRAKLQDAQNLGFMGRITNPFGSMENIQTMVLAGTVPYYGLVNAGLEVEKARAADRQAGDIRINGVPSTAETPETLGVYDPRRKQ